MKPKVSKPGTFVEIIFLRCIIIHELWRRREHEGELISRRKVLHFDFYDWKNMINDAKLFVKLRNGIAHPEEQTLTFWHVRYAISLHRRFCPKKLEHKIYRFSCLFSSFIWKNKVGYSYLLVKRNIKCLFFPFKHRFFCDSVVPRKRWPILAIHSKRCSVSTSCHSAVSEQSPKSNLNWKLYNRKLNIYCLKGYPFPWGSKN